MTHWFLRKYKLKETMIEEHVSCNLQKKKSKL